MKQIRRGTFETNSSSMHSLVIENEKSIGKLEESKLKLNKKGEIEVHLGEYGCFLAFLKTQQEKLNYLVTLIAGSKTIISREDLEDDPEFEYLKKQVLKYTNAANITVYGFEEGSYYIDHQSQQSLSDFLSTYNTETVLKNSCSWETRKESELIGPLDVIFNPNVIIEISRD